jgi:mannobiose 2-epimerase
MWDSRHNGFYWEVDETGRKVLKPAKHLYGQASGLYAVSEYAMASGDAGALGFAIDLFALLEEKAHDQEHGGYLEFFETDWSGTPAKLDPYVGRGLKGGKLMNTHLHLMEAMMTFYRASQLPLAKERLVELIEIESNKVVRHDWGACTGTHARDWTPLLDPPHNQVSYGHDLENVWLLMDAVDTAGLAQEDYHDLYRRLWEYSLKYGYDDEQGGFYHSGPAERPAEDRAKIWWVQAEALLSALRMYEMFGDEKYLRVFSQTLAFVNEKQTDWDVGEWHWRVDGQGVGSGPKATIWKAAYHNGRAMLEGLASLARLQEATACPPARA